MRSLLLFTPALLIACSAAPAQPIVAGQPIVHGDTPGHTCVTDRTQSFIGKPGTAGTGAAIKHVTRAAILRWAPPGYAVSMDFRADRVTIWLDDQRNITKISCG